MILFVSGEYPPDRGGIGDYTLHLRSALDGVGWRSELLTRRNVGRWDARSLVALARAAPRRGVVHIQFQAGAYDLLGDVCLMPLLLHRVRPRVRVTTTFHDVRSPYLFPRAGGLRRLAVQLLARSSDAVVAADARDLDALGGPSARHHRVPIGSNLPCAPPLDYDRADFRRVLGVRAEAPLLAYFGLLQREEDLVLRTVTAVREHRRDAHLIIVGGHGAYCADGVVTRTGWLPAEQVSAHLLAADVALLPYADGASPRRSSLLTCAEHRLPIVSTTPAAPEVAPFVDAVPAEPSALADAVERVLTEAAQADRLRRASAALAQRVAWPRIAAAHVRIYERLLYS